MTGKKTVTVTGGSRAIRAAIIEAFLDRGYDVVVTSRSFAKTGFAPSPHLALFNGGIGQAATAEKVAETAIDKSGSINHVVNIAGIFAAEDGLNSTAGRAERSETGLCGTGPLAMTRLSGREHHSFGAKEIKVLTGAFEDALWYLGIADRTNPAANMVAKRIIELARRGELDLVRLHDYAVRSADTEGIQCLPR